MLDAICREFRIDTEYWDIWGRHHETPEATKRAILASLGLDAHDDLALTQSVQALRENQSRRLLDPVTVLEIGDSAPAVTVRIPDLYDHGTLRRGPSCILVLPGQRSRKIRGPGLPEDPAAGVSLEAPLFRAGHARILT